MSGRAPLGRSFCLCILGRPEAEPLKKRRGGIPRRPRGAVLALTGCELFGWTGSGALRWRQLSQSGQRGSFGLEFVSYLGQRSLQVFLLQVFQLSIWSRGVCNFFLLLTDQQRLGPSGSWAQPERRFSRTERRLDLPVQHHSCTYKHTPARSNEIRPSPELAPCMHGCLV